ncbi:hypothetical protein F4777DRAFT_571726 [Nemania sp. FL0916]|nr:hypothetical protein F4777DRAFT_571726 [Nemania sp. FL0916]
MMISSVFSVALLALGASAHFTVQYPATVGPFKDDDEGTGPCGGYSPSLGSVKTIDFHVGGDAVATKSTHPQTTWLYRITTDDIAKNNWTQVYNIVLQNGPGDYCTKSVTVPAEYVGQKAILSIVADGPDGLLYQCAAVNFVNGTANTPSACTNGSSITASFTNDKKLSGMVNSSLVDDGGDDNTNAPSPTPTGNAAPSMPAFTTSGFGAILTTGAMLFAGFTFML